MGAARAVIMIAPAVKRAFEATSQVPEEPKRPTAIKGGLEVKFHIKFDVGLEDAAVNNTPPRIRVANHPRKVAAATADGAVAFVDGFDGTVVAKWDDDEDDPPNVMVFASKWLIHCSDTCVRILDSETGEMAHSHTVMAPAQDGKRARQSSIDHAIVLDGTRYVAAAGRVVHACKAPEGTLEHSLQITSPVRAMCAAPTSSSSHSVSEWAYAIACADGIRLISSAGEIVHELISKGTVRSLSAYGPWMAAAAMEGGIELWDLVAPRHVDNGLAHVRMNSSCGSDGSSLGFRCDGGGLAVSGRRASVFDFSGANSPHPYRPKNRPPAEEGQPDTSVPRVCMADNAQKIAWAPRSGSRVTEKIASLRGPELATVHEEGVLKLWQPHGVPLRKGGQGNPQQPQMMKPQFYTFVNHDATHPSGEAVKACALMWLQEDVVAVGYFTGEIVAWRVGGGGPAEVS